MAKKSKKNSRNNRANRRDSQRAGDKIATMQDANNNEKKRGVSLWQKISARVSGSLKSWHRRSNDAEECILPKGPSHNHPAGESFPDIELEITDAPCLISTDFEKLRREIYRLYIGMPDRCNDEKEEIMKMTATELFRKLIDDVSLYYGNLKLCEERYTSILNTEHENSARANKLASDFYKIESERDLFKEKTRTLMARIQELENLLNEKEMKSADPDASVEAPILNDEKGQASTQAQDVDTEPTAHHDNTQLKADLAEKQRRCDTIAGELQSKNNDIAALRTDVQEREKTIHEMTSEIERLRKKESDMSQAEQVLIKDKDKLTKDIESLTQTVSDKESLIAARDKTLSEQNEKVEKLNCMNDSLIADKIQLEEKMAQANLDLEKLRHTVAEKEVSAAKAHDSLAATIAQSKTKAVASARALLLLLEKGGYEMGGKDIVASCMEDENINKTRFEQMVAAIEAIDLSAMTSATDFDNALFQVLANDIEMGMEGIVLPLARLCGYSRIPFMRDDRGDTHMSLDRRKTARIESALSTLLALVGIELIIPVPFCDRLEEDDFEDATGNVPNLDYICPNSRAHLDGVDRNDTVGIITDIISVGYRMREHTTKAKVLI